MPDKKNIGLVIQGNLTDIKNHRVPGLNKPLEQVTIGELLANPGGPREDCFSGTVGGSFTVTTDCAPNQLSRQVQDIRAAATVKKVKDIRQ